MVEDPTIGLHGVTGVTQRPGSAAVGVILKVSFATLSGVTPSARTALPFLGAERAVCTYLALARCGGWSVGCKRLPGTIPLERRYIYGLRRSAPAPVGVCYEPGNIL